MISGTFISRINRFAATVSIDGKTETAHVPNSGRLKELFIQGSKVLVTSAANPDRKTRFTLKAVQHEGLWVSIDSTLVNEVIENALKDKELPMFKGATEWKRESTYKGSRFDFFITEESGKGCYLEVKSVTLVKDGTAMFPDAPTERGRKHLLELIDAVRNGFRGMVIFCIQRPDAEAFRPFDGNDPAFGKALREAKRNGVEVYAYKCSISEGLPLLHKEITVQL